MVPLRIDKGLELVVLLPTHAEDLFRLVDRNRAYLKEWLPWLDGTRSAEDARFFIESGLPEFRHNGAVHFGIFETGKLCGVISYNQLDLSNKRTELGYWLSADCQGHGLMTRSCEKLIDYAFHALSMNRVTIRCATGNKKSQAIPKRLGFKREGVMRDAEWLYDRFVDNEVFAILAREWSHRLDLPAPGSKEHQEAGDGKKRAKDKVKRPARTLRNKATRSSK